MNKRFISCLCLATASLLLSESVSYGQRLEKQEDHIYISPNVSGVGSSTIVYHLKTPLETNTLAELENYMKSFKAITQVSISGQDISIQFKHVTTNQMISTLIQRMEMLFIYRNPKSK
jgi:hypothetical protein